MLVFHVSQIQVTYFS